MITAKKFASSATLGILFLGLLTSVVVTPNTKNTTVSAHGGRNDECNNALDINPVNGSLATYTAPAGYTVTSVCIKAGNDMFGDGHSDALGNGTYNGTTGNACYVVTGVGTQTVTVTKVASGNSCKDLSHIDIYKSESTTPTPTNGPTNTPTPTTVVTDEPTPTPTCTPTPGEEDPTPTPSQNEDPTPTPTEQPTATPTPGSSNSTSSTNEPQVQSIAEAKSTQATLSATSMAPTGSFMPNVINGLMSLGVLFLSVGNALYGKAESIKKTKRS